MRFVEGLKYRNLSRVAELMGMRSIGNGGFMSTRRKVFVGELLISNGSQMGWGSDSFNEDRFQNQDGYIGRYTPSCWGVARFHVLAPAVPAKVANNSKEFHLADIGSILDHMDKQSFPNDITANVTLAQVKSLAGLPSGVARLRSAWVSVNLSDISRYNDWREAVVIYEANVNNKVIEMMKSIGGHITKSKNLLFPSYNFPSGCYLSGADLLIALHAKSIVPEGDGFKLAANA